VGILEALGWRGSKGGVLLGRSPFACLAAGGVEYWFDLLLNA
jgi:hypothetical protein